MPFVFSYFSAIYDFIIFLNSAQNQGSKLSQILDSINPVLSYFFLSKFNTKFHDQTIQIKSTNDRLYKLLISDHKATKNRQVFSSHVSIPRLAIKQKFNSTSLNFHKQTNGTYASWKNYMTWLKYIVNMILAF